MPIFDHTHPKIFESTFTFSDFVKVGCKKSRDQFILPVHFWGTVNFRVSWPDLPHPFLIIAIQEVFDQLLIFVNLYQHAKSQLIHLFILQIKPILETCYKTGHTYFLIIFTPKLFNHLLISLNLYQHAKSQLISSVHFWNTVNFRVRDQIGHTHYWL